MHWSADSSTCNLGQKIVRCQKDIQHVSEWSQRKRCRSHTRAGLRLQPEKTLTNNKDAEQSLHSAAIGWFPNLTLHAVHLNRQYEIQLEDTWKYLEPADKPGHLRLLMPFRFQLSFNMSTLSTAFEFNVDSWDNYWLLSQQELFPAGMVPFPNSPLNVVLPPTFGGDDVATAKIVALNVLHHTKLGLGVILYVSKRHVSLYGEHPCLKSLVASNKVTMVTWTETRQFTGNSRAFKSMVWGQAILAGWHRPSKMLITDVDEFLAFNSTWSVQEFLDKCVGDASHATVHRRDTACRACQNAESDASFFGWKDSALSTSISHDCQGTELQQYGPITHEYNVWISKLIVDPQRVLGFVIHVGHVLSGEAVVVNSTCGTVLHLVNLWRNRSPYEERLTVEPFWQP